MWPLLLVDLDSAVWLQAEVLWRYATAVLNDMDCTSWKADAYRWQEAAGLTIPSLGDERKMARLLGFVVAFWSSYTSLSSLNVAAGLSVVFELLQVCRCGHRRSLASPQRALDAPS